MTYDENVFKEKANRKARKIWIVFAVLLSANYGSEKSASGVNQILSLHIFLFINKEILLLCTNRWCHPFGGRISEKSEKS